ncbi:MAG: PilT/PilU family type 4a pilus ATPase [Candidatus Pacebacteria bacterium]|nr:PilT/PilU family type 4a pilus ATPase [Candidatus Paceibacterota bacterium]
MQYASALKKYITVLTHEGGSDLHLSAESRPTIRVDGSLVPMMNEPVLTGKDTEGFLAAITTQVQLELFHKDQELDFSYSPAGGDRFRCNAFYQRGFVGIVMRRIPKEIRTIDELNLPAILETFAHRSQGFFLVVGPVGQGKTTTLTALLDLINKERAAHILTIEDPIEYVHEPKQSLIDQREVHIDTKDFAVALRGAFRQDIDVMLVGEMRGPETMAAAVTAAETGHLVFSTLHTNNAAQTIDRIIDSFPADQQDQIRLQLSASLAGIFSQRLIPRVSGGMIAAYELLISNKAVQNLIREGRTHEINTVIETSSAEGMISMEHTLADLVARGEITQQHAYEHSINPKMLDRLI